MSGVCAVIVTRDDNAFLGETVLAAGRQVENVVVVDDGSRVPVDVAGVDIVRLPPHRLSYVGRPELAERWNAGLRAAEKYSPNYILMLGADHALPPWYVSRLKSLIKGTNIVICAGRYRGEWFKPENPGGSGRLIDARWWTQMNGMRFPFNWGWESWIVYAAEAQGYSVRCFEEAETQLRRPIQMNAKKAYAWGKGSWCLGYDPLVGLMRCVYYARLNPLWGIAMAAGVILHPECVKYPTWSIMHQQMRQRRMFRDFVSKGFKMLFGKVQRKPGGRGMIT